jgi:hypothetical protein
MLRGGLVETALALGGFVALAGPVHALLPSSAALVDPHSARSVAVMGSHFAWGVLLALWLGRRVPSVNAGRVEASAR